MVNGKWFIKDKIKFKHNKNIKMENFDKKELVQSVANLANLQFDETETEK